MTNDLHAQGRETAEEAVRRHAQWRGKIQVMPKCELRGPDDFSVWYTPGVAAACRAIQTDPQRVYELTNKANSVAIVTDGSRVLGLGNIGPEAGLPVMEGKALLFKYLGDVDAFPICLATQDPDELVRTVELLEPSFGGINLEDIAQPKCFRILERLRATMKIPVWHDDQQGSATGLIAGLANALKVVGKDLGRVRIAMIGMGAANVSAYRLLKASGANPGSIVACDSKGILHRMRADIDAEQQRLPEKWTVCRETNIHGVTGGIAEAMRGADVCIAFSRPGPEVILPEWVRTMARDAIVFACANPTPEIWPEDARAAGARIVATGRGDFPNQLNNSLVFPAIFRGALDVRASTISDEMALAAATELALCAQDRGLRDDFILPRMEDWEAAPRVAAATALKAQEQGIARGRIERDGYQRQVTARILRAREATALLQRATGSGT
jgi:malate dehydrogenase (oxaloacetate-decarboxylating)